MPPRICALLLGALLLLMTIAMPALAQPAEAPPAEEGTGTPAYSTLADMLENEQSRTQLIEQLRQLAAEEVPEAAPPDSTEIVGANLPAQLATLTSKTVSEFGEQFDNLVSSLGALFDGSLTSSSLDLGLLMTAALNLGLVIIATFALFLVIRRLVRPLFAHLSQWSLNGRSLYPIVRQVLCSALALLIDAMAVGLAYVGGNLAATFIIGETGNLSTQASLFLNAFLVIELLKAGMRMLFASRYEGIRLLPIGAKDASYWNRWIARLIGLAGYGLMVVVPLISLYLSESLSKGAGALIMLCAWFYAIIVILINRTKVRDGLLSVAQRATLPASSVAIGLLARTWHLLAIVYFTVVLMLTLTQPERALPYVLIATAKTLAIVLVASLVSRGISQIIGRRITLSDELRQKLPLLEPRLNSYIPALLRVINILILITAVMSLANAWGLFDIASWYASESGRNLVTKTFNVAVILIVAAIVWVSLASLIEHKLSQANSNGQSSARTHTLLSLFRNALAIALVTMTLMIVLSEIGINIGPLIAGAGVLGLAIGFGAQKLVQDIITGIFIQVENAMNTGDVVTLGGITGTAEKLNIRSVGVRDLNGTYHLIPFSSVDVVSNYMRGFAYHVGEYRIAYRESIDEAIIALHNAFEELTTDPEMKLEIVAPLEVQGVTALADSAVHIRVRIKTTPGMQWAVGRAYNRLVKLHLDDAGIEIPFPHTTVYFGEDKQGHAPAANLRLVDKTGYVSPESSAPQAGEDGSVQAPEIHNAPEEAEIKSTFKGDYPDSPEN
uniref:mechanosensitive ion channel domain-containing protein n=1 Tax=Halomonas sp. TaxID=1486246 RepID=UPI00260CFD1B|nr:mechanosensitive ion channel domain-containing protein [Halomonas sp.]